MYFKEHFVFQIMPNHFISFTFYAIRLLHVLTMSKSIAPKLVMIRKMMTDILTLLSILGVFMMMYGVISQSLLYPNHNDWKFTVRRMFRRAYFHIYGELFLEEIDYIPGTYRVIVWFIQKWPYSGHFCAQGLSRKI